MSGKGKPKKPAQERLGEDGERFFAALDELVSAAEDFLARIDGITTEEFSKGGERMQRERLRNALLRIGRGSE